jgi:hypothetical protein
VADLGDCRLLSRPTNLLQQQLQSSLMQVQQQQQQQRAQTMSTLYKGGLFSTAAIPQMQLSLV